MVTQRPPIAYPIDPTGKRHRPIAYRKATLVPRHLAVGRWSLVAPISAIPLDVLDGGWRIAWDGGPHDGLGGYIDAHRLVVGKESNGRRAPMIQLSGPDDMTVLAERLAYPDPSQPATNQTAQAYDRRTAAQASTVILEYIRRNAGDLAIAGRETPNFISAIADPLIGGSASGQARFETVLEVVGPIAEEAGLAVTITSTTAGVRTLAIAAVRDLTAKARYSIALRNLHSLDYQMAAPTATYVVAGGRGDEAARMFRAANNASAASTWRRIEAFTDARSARNDDGGAELQAAADQARDDAGPKQTVNLVPLDTERLTYGVDVFLGDRVLGEVGFGTGLKVPAIIREAEITIDRANRGRLVDVKLRASTLPSSGRLAADRALRALAGRVGRLERHQ